MTAPSFLASLLSAVVVSVAAPAAAQVTAPSGHASARLPDGTIVVLGGDGSGELPSAAAFSIAPGTEATTPVGSLVLPRTHATAVPLFDGRILVAGGNDGYGGMASLELFDPLTSRFQLSRARLAAPRQDAACFALRDGRVLVRGGSDRGQAVTLDEVYDPRTDTVGPLDALPLTAYVETDRLDYQPGDVVYVSGSGFEPGENVALLLDEDPLVHAPATFVVVADANGDIAHRETYYVDAEDLGTRFVLTAVGASSNLSVATRFSDGDHLQVQVPQAFSVPAGQPFTLSFNVVDNGKSGATPAFTGVQLTVSAPSGWSISASSGGPFAGSATVSGITVLSGQSLPFTLYATAASGGGAGTFTASVSGTVVPPLTCSSQGVSCNDTKSVTVTGTVTKSSQTITFPALAPVSYGVAPLTLGATASSGLPVSYAASPASVCTVSGSTLAVIGAGTCAVTASQAGNAQYHPAPTVQQDVLVDRAALTVTADAKTRTYGEADPALTWTVTAGALVGSDQLAGALARDPGQDVGTYAIRQGTLAASANYALTFVGASLTITPRALTVTADAKTKVYGDADPALTYHVTTGNLVGGDAFTGALARAGGESVGTYALQQGSLTLTTNYVLTYVGANLTIGKRPITVAADAQTKVYGEPDPALTCRLAPGSTLAFAETLAVAVSGAPARAPGEHAGTYGIVQGTLAATGNYDLNFIASSLTIARRPIAIAADAETKIYGAADPALTFTLAGGSLGFLDALANAVSGALARVAGEDVGTYAIQQGTLVATPDYLLVAFTPAALAITARPLTVTADALTKTYGDADPALTYAITDGTLAFSDGFTGLLTRVAGDNVGTYAIQQGTLGLSANYQLTYVGANLTITPRALTVTADAETKILGAADPSPLTYRVTTGNLVGSDTFAGALMRAAGEAVGTYPILQGTLTAGGNYALTFVSANFAILYAPAGPCYGAAGHQVLPPINVDGSSVWKTGSTVPVKFRVCDAHQNSIGTAGVVKAFGDAAVGSATGLVNESTIDSTTPDTSFRWDDTARQWIFNLSTKNLQRGVEYAYRIVLDDGTPIDFKFGLK